MAARGRKIVALVVALGMFFSAAAPAMASPAGDSNVMPGMTMMSGMDGNCMEMAANAKPAKQVPGKGDQGSCAFCIACAVSLGLSTDLMATPIFWRRNAGLIAADVSPDGIAIPPALPPPILRA